MKQQMSELETCRQRVAARARAAQGSDRMRLWVNAIPVLGAPVAVGLAWLHPLLGSVAVASLVLGWILGIYRTEKLCQHTAGRLQDAEHDLTRLRAHADTERGQRADFDASAAAWPHAGARLRKQKPGQNPMHH